MCFDHEATLDESECSRKNDLLSEGFALEMVAVHLSRHMIRSTMHVCCKRGTKYKVQGRGARCEVRAGFRDFKTWMYCVYFLVFFRSVGRSFPSFPRPLLEIHHRSVVVGIGVKKGRALWVYSLPMASVHSFCRKTGRSHEHQESRPSVSQPQLKHFPFSTRGLRGRDLYRPTSLSDIVQGFLFLSLT